MNREIDTSCAIARTSSPVLDAILGHSFPVLDHGFVRVVDYMGDDAAICQMARTSYGEGTKATSDDEGLIRYLMRHHHTSPFEGCEIKLHIKMPIFVARQWIRHRTACLAGDVKVDFDLPGGVKRKGCQKYTLTMQEIYKRFQPTENVNRPDKQRNPYRRRDRVKEMLLRSCDETEFSPIRTKIVNIWQSGVKPIIAVSFSNGGKLRATADHMCFTDKGWLRLGDALGSGVKFAAYGRNEGSVSEPISVKETSEVWREIPEWPEYSVSSQGRVRGARGIKKNTVSDGGYHVVSLSRSGVSRAYPEHHLVLSAFNPEDRNGRESRHLNGNRQDNRIENLCWGSAKENAEDRMRFGSDQRQSMIWVDVSHWKYDGEEMTYDMEVAGQFHNFVAGGVIVHNSLNEVSGRYSVLPGEFYLPDADRLGYQSKTNKQGTGEGYSAYEAAIILDWMENAYGVTDGAYRSSIEDYDLAREQARIVLPLSTYTEMYWKIDLHNLFHFLRLRCDSHAQYEIRVYADLIADLVRQWTPAAHQAWVDYQRDAVTLSRMELEVLRKMISGVPMTSISSMMNHLPFVVSKREVDEFLKKMGIT